LAQKSEQSSLSEPPTLIEDKKPTKSKKRFWWLKLQETFFGDIKIKKLRRLADGDTLTIIYLKMQLLSLRNDGILIHDGVEESFAEELALALDEETENVKLVLVYLEKQKLIERLSDSAFLLPEAAESMGSETDAAERMRNMRSKKGELLSDNNEL